MSIERHYFRLPGALFVNVTVEEIAEMLGYLVAELNAHTDVGNAAKQCFEHHLGLVAVAVGGSASALRRLVGTVLDHESLERGLRILATTPSERVARTSGIEAERVRLLPAGMLILEEISDRLERQLNVGRGGLREGVIVDLLIAAGWGA